MSVQLERPACPKGCAPCQRECAVARIIGGWWHGELLRLLNNGGSAEDIAEAQEHCARQRRKIVPGSHPVAPVQLRLVPQ